MNEPRAFFATAPKGMEPLLADELTAMGAANVQVARAGVSFEGDLSQAYRACLWSRTASRVLLPLATFSAPDADALYKGIKSIDWSRHLEPSGTLAVDFSSTESAISHTHFGALKAKDAIVDQFRERTGQRPSVERQEPDVRVNVYVNRDQASVSIDLSGESLHRRGWRQTGTEAPLKENLADAVLLLAQWPRRAKEGQPLLDPMCGSGSLPIEAALIALDVAPGLARRHYGFLRWKGHRPELWGPLLAEARQRDGRGKVKLPPIVGYDLDPRAVRIALGNAERAGLQGVVHFEKRELGEADPVGDKPGILVANPPYGERLGEVELLAPLYRRIGDSLKQRFPHWTGYVLTGNLELSKEIGLRATRRHVLFNGAIECRLLEIPIEAKSAGGPRVLSPGAQAFANRLEKDLKHLSKWAKREGVTCWRVYDADMPEYAVAVDLYEGKWVHVQEYERPATVDEAQAQKRLRETLTAIPEVLGVKPTDVFLKVRRKRRAGEQYEKLEAKADFRPVHEAGHRFLVNFTDYLDTGLFLDHRITRRMVGELAKGRSFLNLFAYTGTATVYAAKAGAATTCTVDLSNTYLDWAQRNLELNGIRGGNKHELVRADVLEFVRQERARYGVIFLDPPTFSNSKSMRGTWDVQRDHPELLKGVSELLEPDGVLVFSTNARKFKLDKEALEGLVVEDLSARTIPPDFERNPRIHRTFQLRRG